eukprot:jgi/Mesen1/10833/ME000093S10354
MALEAATRIPAVASGIKVGEESVTSTSGLRFGQPIPDCYLGLGSPFKRKPLFSFGVITDVQYADIPDGTSFFGSRRYYRHSLEVLRRAVKHWNTGGSSVSFAVHFGDILDGFCPSTQSFSALQRVLHEFKQLQGGVTYHMIGNHCLYNFPRETLNKLLGIAEAPDGGSYYEFSPHPGFRFVVLDGYDVSALGRPPDHPHTRLAKKLLDAHNPNAEKNSPQGLTGPARRFVKFGGGVGERQLAWFDAVLEGAAARGEKVLVGCHLPLEPTSLAVGTCLLWNYQEVLDVMHRHRCVVVTFGGHAHVGGYAVDAHRVHHRVLEAVVECPPGSDAFGRVDVYPDCINLVGVGRLANSFMPYSSRQSHL